jgi:hypothetical protein
MLQWETDIKPFGIRVHNYADKHFVIINIIDMPYLVGNFVILTTLMNIVQNYQSF